MSISVLVTGGCGYIGAALMKYLRRDLEIKNVISYDIVQGDNILNYEALVSRIRDHKINVVVHLAALSSVSACNEKPKTAKDINGLGTGVVVSAMAEAGCQNIIYASTSSVYGNSDIVPYTEDMKPAPCSVYGSSKLLGEGVIHDYHLGNYLIFRLFNVVGTSGFHDLDMKTNAGYDRIFGALMSGHVTIYGNDYITADGTCERDYVSLKDVCQAFILGIKAITTQPSLRITANIASNHPTSVMTLINTWNTIATTPVTYIYGPRREGDPTQVYGLNGVAYKMLGWTPTRKIEDIIRDIAMDIK